MVKVMIILIGNRRMEIIIALLQLTVVTMFLVLMSNFALSAESRSQQKQVSKLQYKDIVMDKKLTSSHIKLYCKESVVIGGIHNKVKHCYSKNGEIAGVKADLYIEANSKSGNVNFVMLRFNSSKSGKVLKYLLKKYGNSYGYTKIGNMKWTEGKTIAVFEKESGAGEGSLSITIEE